MLVTDLKVKGLFTLLPQQVIPTGYKGFPEAAEAKLLQYTRYLEGWKVCGGRLNGSAHAEARAFRFESLGHHLTVWGIEAP